MIGRFAGQRKRLQLEQARSRDANSPLRGGFTLMETLVAVALLGMIMASVGASIDLYWRYRTLSRDRVASSQILRGIMEDMTCDLRMATMPDMFTISSRAQSLGKFQSPGEIQSIPGTAAVPIHAERTLRVEEQLLDLRNPQGDPVHFVGTNTSLAVLTHYDSPRFQASDAYSTIRQRHVVWWKNDGSSVRLPLAHKGPQLLPSTLAASGQPNGLVRLIKPFAAQNSSRSEQQEVILISPNVTSIQLRYYDGSEWVSEWNSSLRIALPHAVEVSLMMAEQPDRTETSVIWLPQG